MNHKSCARYSYGCQILHWLHHYMGKSNPVYRHNHGLCQPKPRIRDQHFVDPTTYCAPEIGSRAGIMVPEPGSRSKTFAPGTTKMHLPEQLFCSRSPPPELPEQMICSRSARFGLFTRPQSKSFALGASGGLPEQKSCSGGAQYAITPEQNICSVRLA